MSDIATEPTMDPVTLAVLRGRLEQIADEMDATLYRSAFNPIIAEAHDACHGLYAADSGDTLVQGKSGLPVFVGAMAFAVRAAARVARERSAPDDPCAGMTEGDTWLFNDPYEGGTHANDFKLVRPFFRQGRLFCYVASAAHWHDVGGAVPGNYNPAATECWQEAVQIPPVRIIRAGVLDDDVLAILKANTRLPESLWGDLNGQLAALDLGVRRLNGLLDEYGDAVVLLALGELRTRAVKLMRSHIAAMPDGHYAFSDILDNDGVKNEALTIALDMTVQGDRMTLDFSRTSAQCAGPVNISRATARGPGHQRRTAATRGRVHRNHLAHDRCDFQRRRTGGTETGHGTGLRHHQCAVDRGPPHGPRPQGAALGDVQLFRWWPRRPLGR
jgi:N-methylhydantoinase B